MRLHDDSFVEIPGNKGSKVGCLSTIRRVGFRYQHPLDIFPIFGEHLLLKSLQMFVYQTLKAICLKDCL